MTVAHETQQVLGMLERVEKVERVAHSLAPGDEGRQTLMEVVEETLRAVPPVRPVIAAQWLRLSEPTVRNWLREGVLSSVATKPRVLLDPQRLHQVAHLLADLRAAGKTDRLLDELYRRLTDATWLDNDALAESLGQMRDGDYVVVRERPTESA